MKNRFEGVTRRAMWSMAFVLVAFMAGCWNDANDPILGGIVLGGIPGAPGGAIAPGASCINAGPTIPAVSSSSPVNGDQAATNSTSVTATFSLAMNPATLNSSPAGTLLTYTLKNNSTGINVSGTVAMNGANTIATFSTSAPLAAGTSYTAIITRAATSAAGTPLGCIYAWNFRTAVASNTGVNLGRAAPFASAATAGVTNTPTAPITHINGDIVLDPNATCNAVTVGAAGGFGLCGGAAPTITGTVISPLFPDAGATSGAVKADMNAAFLSITPPAGPPAAGSLGGATNLPAGTTLGAPTGSALVQGDNLFVAGVYQSLTSILITGDLALDAQNNPNAVFIFQSSSTVGTADGAASPGVHTRILLLNGAKASNVWWQAASSATIGTNSEFVGNILAAASVTMKTGATSCGRLFAGAWVGGGGAFVFDSNVVSVPGNVNAPLCQ